MPLSSLSLFVFLSLFSANIRADPAGDPGLLSVRYPVAEGDPTEVVAYVLGSMHIAKIENLHSRYLSVFDKARVLVKEGMPASVSGLREAGWLIDEKKKVKGIWGKVPGGTRLELESVVIQSLKTRNFTYEPRSKSFTDPFGEVMPLRRLYPWAMFVEYCQSAYSEGLDSQLLKRFGKKGRVFGLEHLHEVSAMFAPHKKMSVSTISEYIKLGVKDNIEENYAHELKSYYSGEMLTDPDSILEHSDPVTVDRNLRWMPRLKKLFAEQSKPVFVMVGMGHLLGVGGVLSLLNRGGYIVERLDVSTGSFVSFDLGSIY